MQQHGASAYKRGICRCDTCKAAMREYRRASRLKRGLTVKRLPVRNTAWMDHAACRSQDPIIFCTPDDPYAVKAAKAICATCPVVAECNGFAKSTKADGVVQAARVWRKKSLEV